jgi:hypothetical protein
MTTMLEPLREQDYILYHRWMFHDGRTEMETDISMLLYYKLITR